MNADEALGIIEQTLSNASLSQLQATVFRQSWNELSYQEIALKAGYELGYVKQTGSQLWQILSKALGEKVTKTNVQTILKRKVQAGIPHSDSIAVPVTDWGDAPDVSMFCGRTLELDLLQQWVLQDHCRLMGLFGMGGIGKTSLAVKLAQQVQAEFDWVIWRSLRHAPTLNDLLSDLLQCFARRQGRSGNSLSPNDLPETLEGRMLLLLSQLRQSRCLLIFDNGETLMQQGDHRGGYQTGYEAYATFFRCLGETVHQSSVILTSREKPAGIAAMEGEWSPIRSLRLSGLPPQVGQEIFSVKGEFLASAQEWHCLVEHYAGNPLALKMVAAVIKDFFGGRIGDFLEFLSQGNPVFGDIRDLLSSQIDRLSELERQVLYWLAIDREPLTLSELRSNFIPQVPLSDLLEALTSLERRSLIEKHRMRFTLQPAVMEYLTDRLIRQISQEILSSGGDSLISELKYFRTHALLKAQAKEYIREAQGRLLLKPVADQLLQLRGQQRLEAQFQALLSQLRQTAQEPGYAVGNLLNLCGCLGSNLQGWDFSGLPIRQAYLVQTPLQQVNLSQAMLSRSVFSETCSQILSLAFSPDGQLLATGDVNHEIQIWQIAAGEATGLDRNLDSQEIGKQLLTLKVDEGWVWAVAFSPNGRILASSANRVINLWDAQTGQRLRMLPGHDDRIFSLAFSPDGQFLASGSEDHRIRIWEVKTGRLLSTLTGHTDEVRSVSFAPPRYTQQSQDLWLASGSHDQTVRLWDVKTGQCLSVLQKHRDGVWSVSFSPDGRLIASAGADCTIRLWDVEQRRCLRTLKGHTQQTRTLAFSADGQTLASGGDDRTIRLWNPRTGDCLCVLQGHQSWISAIAFNPRTNVLASGAEDRALRLWDTRSSLCLKTLQGHSNGIWSVALSPDQVWLASGSQDGIVRLWNSRSGTCDRQLLGHTSWIWSVAFHPQARWLASSSEDRTIRLWDHHTGELLQILKGHREAVFAIALHPNGQVLYSGSLDGTIKFWHLTTGRCDQTLRQHQGGVWSLALSADGQWLASGSQDQTIRLWDTQTGKCLSVLISDGSWVRCLSFSPDRQFLLSGEADGRMKIWHLPSMTCIQSWQAHTGSVLSIVCHPSPPQQSGWSFASSGADTLIKIWQIPADPCQTPANCQQILQGHDKWVKCLSYSPQGQFLASCSQDESIKIWDRQGQCQQTLRIPRPYEGMNITGIRGLTPAQKLSLKRLGALVEA